MMHAGGRDNAGPADIVSGIGVFYTACALMAGVVAVTWLMIRLL